MQINLDRKRITKKNENDFLRVEENLFESVSPVTKQIPVRMSTSLFEQLCELAEKEERSVSSQIVYILRSVLNPK